MGGSGGKQGSDAAISEVNVINGVVVKVVDSIPVTGMVRGG